MTDLVFIQEYFDTLQCDVCLQHLDDLHRYGAQRSSNHVEQRDSREHRPNCQLHNERHKRNDAGEDRCGAPQSLQHNIIEPILDQPVQLVFASVKYTFCSALLPCEELDELQSVEKFVEEIHPLSSSREKATLDPDRATRDEAHEWPTQDEDEETSKR
jgi:hypothetical protein